MSYKRHLYLEIVFIYFLKSLHCNRYSLTKRENINKMQQKHISQLHTCSSYEQNSGASHGCVQTSSIVHPPTRAHSSSTPPISVHLRTCTHIQIQICKSLAAAKRSCTPGRPRMPVH